MGVHRALKNTRNLLAAHVRLARFPKRECSLCGFVGGFWPYGDPPRVGALCPRCGSLERHRLLAQWMQSNPVFDGARILHFAPEPIIAAQLKNHTTSYRSADLNPGPGVDAILDIESIDLPENSVDVVVCSHVLEHVNDAKALSEIHRVLTDTGLAVIMVPLIEGWDQTYEDPAITSPSDRRTYFGQADHVRWFGRDLRDRIEHAGFALSEFTAEEPFVTRYGLTRGEKVFLASPRQIGH